MTGRSGLESRLSYQLHARAGRASVPDDAWNRLVARLGDVGGADATDDTDGPSDGPSDGEVIDLRADEMALRQRLLGGRHWPLALVGVAAAAVILAIVVFSSLDEDASELEIVDDPAPPTEVDPTPTPASTPAEDATAPAGSAALVAWSQVEGLRPEQVVSDGRAWFALQGSDLFVSDDGVTWDAAATDVPFSDIGSASNARIVTMESEAGPFPNPPIDFTVHTADRDGTIVERVATLTVPEAVSSVLEHVDASVHPLGPDGLVITGSYQASFELLRGVGAGLTIDQLDEIKAASGQEPEDDISAALAAAAGISLFEFEEEVDFHAAAISLGMVENEVGVVGVDIPIAFALVTEDGESWVQLDAGTSYGYDVTPIEGGLVGIVLQDDLRQVPAFSADGTAWTEVSDSRTGSSLGQGGRLFPAGDEAYYLTAVPPDVPLRPRIWRVAATEAFEVGVDSVELDSADLDSVENNAVFGFGEAGIVYLTGFTAGVPQESSGPTEIVVSTDGVTWSRTVLPTEMVDIDSDLVQWRIAVGASGVLLWGQHGVWFGDMSAA